MSDPPTGSGSGSEPDRPSAASPIDSSLRPLSPLPGSSQNPPPGPTPASIKKQAISNLNKTLKAKQKMKGAPFALAVGDDGEKEIEEAIPTPDDDSKQKRKHKRISKQTSTKTDFFAAKLASAVDDCDSSDSDETFVYENQAQQSEPQSAVASIYSPGVVEPEPDLGTYQAQPLSEQADALVTHIRSPSVGSNSSVVESAPASEYRPLALRKSMSTVADDTGISAIADSPEPSVVDDKPFENYSYDEVDVDDDISSDEDENDDAESTITAPAPLKKKKSPSIATSSSKLRSTTSKLFDKKGSQPRRYSIIPNDIDIDDFDDDIIYYDNARFPYGGSSTPGNEVPQFCGPPLQPQPHKLPHVRSLNLKAQVAPQTGQSKKKHHRYFSMGAPMPSGTPTNQPSWTTGLLPSRPTSYDTFEDEPLLQQFPPTNELNKKASFASSRYRNPLMSPHGHYRLKPEEITHRGRFYCLKSFLYTLVSVFLIMTVGFALGFILATSKDLTEVSIPSIDHAVVSSDELVFDMAVSALNPGWFTIDISEVDLSIFAKSGYIKSKGIEVESVETVYLGSVAHLEVPISFKGGFFDRERQTQVAEIKLVAPGKNITGLLAEDDDDDNSEKWDQIIKHPFDLILRGNLQYKLPMSSQPKFVQVNKVGYIDPSSD